MRDDGDGAGGRGRAWLAARRWLPVAAALPLVLLWLGPHIVSYDDHVTPCRMILDDGALPAVDACWECHQPPLYYVVGAVALGVARAATGELGAATSFAALKLLNLLLALGTLALLAALVRRFFPDGPDRLLVQTLALLLALVTPRFVLSSVMMGNDSAVLLLATLALWIAAKPVAGFGRAAALGAVVGAAVLAKYNGFALVPAAAAAVLWPWWRREATFGRAAARLAVAALVFGAVAAPWFVRNLVISGTPLPTRMARVQAIESDAYTLFDLRPLALLETPFRLAERVRPGQTLPYRDLQVLTPADTSLWTKTFALWWHDALYYLPQPAPAWTAARYVAAFPVCLVALLGLAAGLRALGRRRGPAPPGAAGHVAALVVVLALLALYVAFVARYPWVRMGHGRAAFLLPLVGPFALSWGLGWLALTSGRSRAVRGLLLGSLAALVALSVAYEVFLVT